MINLKHVYTEIENQIIKVRQITDNEKTRLTTLSMIGNRAGLLLSLDVVLLEYRKNHGSLFIPLNGHDALIHLIINKYHWPISEVRKLSLTDIILSISEELAFDNLPAYLQSFLVSINYNANLCCFDNLVAEEWDPNLGQKLLSLID